MIRALALATALLPLVVGSVAAQQVLEFTAMDFAFRAPTSARAGLTTIRLRNTGQRLHHVQLFKLDEGKRLSDLFPVIYRNQSIHNAPAWAIPAGGPSAALPGSTIEVRQSLAPGRYAAICWIPAPDGQLHVMKGMMAEFEVTGPVTSGAEPSADIRVTLREYRADLSTPLTRGNHTLRIENAGTQSHEFLLVRLAPGKTPEDVDHWSGNGQTGPSPAEEWVGLAGIAPRGVAFLSVSLRPGRYAIICFAPDAKDGRPHLLHGFRSVFEVR